MRKNRHFHQDICLCGFKREHDDVTKWKHFPRYWPFVRGIHRSPVNSPHKGQWRGALMFSLISAWINDWINNREAGDLRRYRAHYDVIVTIQWNVSQNTALSIRMKMSSAKWKLFSLEIKGWSTVYRCLNAPRRISGFYANKCLIMEL